MSACHLIDAIPTILPNWDPTRRCDFAGQWWTEATIEDSMINTYEILHNMRGVWWQEYFQVCDLPNHSQYRAENGQHLWDLELSPLDAKKRKDLDEREEECLERFSISLERVRALDKEIQHRLARRAQLRGILGLSEGGNDEQ